MPDLNAQQFPLERLQAMHSYEYSTSVGNVAKHWAGEEGYGDPSPADVSRTRKLASTLKREGIKNPVTVREESDGFQHLVHGHHRVAAAAQLGWATVPARVERAG